ncbi:hypothetical protein FGG08_004018, partial [Glutinoglossum americanum]
MAPLGIITAFVSAIRVGGPKWLRALVGRARENIAGAEVELMSSTSHEVCELYNGKAIVRTVGKPVVKQLIYLEWLKDQKELGLFSLAMPEGYLSPEDPQGPLVLLASKATNSIHRIKGYTMNKLRKPERKGDVELGDTLSRPEGSQLPDKSPQEKEPQFVVNSDINNEAPNISLNLHGGSDIVELALFALLGIILQAGVLVFSGFAAYHPHLNAKLGGPITRAGFPLQAAGTIILALGMMFCSLVIEQSTKEKRWVVKDGANSSDPGVGGEKPVRVLWLQKGDVVSDQRFDSFLLMAEGKRDEILTSRRSNTTNVEKTEDEKCSTPAPEEGSYKGEVDTHKKVLESARKNYLEVLTVLGIVCGIFGFIVQFAGFRLSNWSSAIAQLVAVFLMTILRAVVRRGLVKNPAKKQLDEKYEMDWLALQIAENPNFLRDFSDPGNAKQPSAPNWEVITPNPDNLALRWNTVTQTGGKGTQTTEEGQEGQAQNAVKIRQRLGQLTKWVGVASDQAIAVANAIEVIMNKLLPSVEFEGRAVQQTFIWRLGVSYGTRQEIGFTVTQVTRGQIKLWRVDATEIEAALSLWNYHFWRKYYDLKTRQQDSGQYDWLRSAKNIMARPCRRVLGPNTDALHQDLAWWIGDGVAQESRAGYEGQSTEVGLRLGFSGLEPNSDSSGKSPKLWLSLSGRMSPSMDLTEDSSKQKMLEVNTSWELSLAQHMFSAFMWAIAEKVPRKELGPATVDPRMFNVDDYSTWNSPELQNAKLLEIAREIQSSGLGTLEEVYSSIIPPLSCANKLPNEAMVELVRQKVFDYETNCRWEKASEVYLRLLELSEKRSLADRFVRKAVAAAIEFLMQATAEPLAEDQDASYKVVQDLETIKRKLVEKLKGSALWDVTVGLGALYMKQNKFRGEQYESLFKDNEKTEANEDFTDNYEYNQETDVLGWTKLHHDVLGGRVGDEKRRKLAKSNISDIAGRRPLHYAVMENNLDLVKYFLNEGGDVNLRGRDGMLPLHWAAKLGHHDVANFLLRGDAKRDASDNAGRTPLHWAAKGGHEVVVKQLLETGKADAGSKDRGGRTPLHLAAQGGYEAVAKQLLETGEADAGSKDHRDGWTPLHLAAQGGHEA